MALRLIFFGTPVFAKNILESLLDKGAHVVAVVTKPDKAVGRSRALVPPPVKLLAKQKIPEVPLYQPTKASAPEFAKILEAHDADLFVVAAYSEILRENLLSMPKLDCINVHGSLLPKYRGAAPVQRAIMDGEKESGVTIMSMVKELDAGDMLKRVSVVVPERMTSGELLADLSKVGAEALWDVISAFEHNTVVRTAQDPSQVTFAPKITLEDAKVHWDRPASQVYNRIRGVTPKPGAWCEVSVRGQKRRLLIKKSSVNLELSGKPSDILEHEGLVVACQEGSVNLLTVQLEGKKEQEASIFVRGFPKSILHFF